MLPNSCRYNTQSIERNDLITKKGKTGPLALTLPSALVQIDAVDVSGNQQKISVKRFYLIFNCSERHETLAELIWNQVEEGMGI